MPGPPDHCLWQNKAFLWQGFAARPSVPVGNLATSQQARERLSAPGMPSLLIEVLFRVSTAWKPEQQPYHVIHSAEHQLWAWWER